MASLKSYGIRECQWCSVKFDATRANQIYCKQECCKLATNKKLIEKYHKNKSKKTLDARTCECGAKLSIYNKDKTCYSCQSRRADEKRLDVLKRLGFDYIQE